MRPPKLPRFPKPSISPEELQRQTLQLEKRAGLWANPEFQELFVKPVEEMIQALEESEWVTDNAELTRLLREFGVSGPQTSGDLLTLFLCARSVVASWRNRLKPFRNAEAALNSLKKESQRGS